MTVDRTEDDVTKLCTWVSFDEPIIINDTQKSLDLASAISEGNTMIYGEYKHKSNGVTYSDNTMFSVISVLTDQLTTVGSNQFPHL